MGVAAHHGGGRGGSLLFLNSLRHNDTALQARFLARNRTLERIRSNIYLSGTFVRDSLLAPEAIGRSSATGHSGGVARRSRKARSTTTPPGSSRKKRPLSRICGLKLESYWKVLDRTFAWSADERGKYRDAFFYEELVPRRTSMLQIADRIESLNEEALGRGDVKLGDLFGRLHSDCWRWWQSRYSAAGLLWPPSPYSTC